jgi:hypothetical protein
MADIDKLLEQVLDYTIEYYKDGEVVDVVPEVGRGDERAYVKFDDAFMHTHFDKQRDVDRMCLRSQMVGELASFDIRYE